jgi:hypothetical protein
MTEAVTYFIRNWREFQHFKDRRPPWIKLHRSLLDNLDWHELDASDSKLLVMLWLIASEDVQLLGKLPHTRELAFRLRISEPDVEQLLQRLSHWLEHHDSGVMSGRCQPDNTLLQQPRRGDTASEVQRGDREETETEGDHGADAPLSPEFEVETASPGLSPIAQPKAERGSGEQGGSRAPRGRLCPDDFQPTEKHYAAGAERGLSRNAVDDICARMHDWSHANANRQIARKTDWSLTLHNFIRDHAEKRGLRPGRIEGIV